MNRDFRHHKYTWSKPFGSVNHRWEFVVARGAVHFHVSLTDDYGPSAGLEFHHTYGNGAPDDRIYDRLNPELDVKINVSKAECIRRALVKLAR